MPETTLGWILAAIGLAMVVASIVWFVIMLRAEIRDDERREVDRKFWAIVRNQQEVR